VYPRYPKSDFNGEIFCKSFEVYLSNYWVDSFWSSARRFFLLFEIPRALEHLFTRIGISAKVRLWWKNKPCRWAGLTVLYKRTNFSQLNWTTKTNTYLMYICVYFCTMLPILCLKIRTLSSVAWMQFKTVYCIISKNCNMNFSNLRQHVPWAFSFSV